jgi:hypothetical protein
MRLLVAWIVSASVSAFAACVGMWLAGWLLGLPLGWLSGFLTFFLAMLGFYLVLQLVYGGLLYVVLGRLGWRTLPVVLFAYLVPVIVLTLVTTDITVGVPNLIGGTSLAVLGWRLTQA